MIVVIEPRREMLDAVEKRLAAIDKETKMNDVLKKAISEAAKFGKEKLYAETRRYYTIKEEAFKKSDIRKRLVSSKNLRATIIVKGYPLGVYQGYDSRKNEEAEGAGVQVVTGSAMRELRVYSGGRAYKAFFATMKSRHEGIFQRKPEEYMRKRKPVYGKSKGREAIKEIQSLSKAKAAEMVYRRIGLGSDIQEEIQFCMLKHMNVHTSHISEM